MINESMKRSVIKAWYDIHRDFFMNVNQNSKALLLALIELKAVQIEELIYNLV